MLVKIRWRALASAGLTGALCAVGCADDDAGRFAADGTELAEYRYEAGPGLSVSTDAVTLSVNESVQLTVTLRDENGETSDVSDQARWSSEEPSIAWAQQGKILGVYPGLTQISVTHAGMSTRVSVAITAQSLETIEVLPSTFEVANGLSVPVRAFGVFRQDARRDITGLVRWSSSDTEIAAVDRNNVHGRGLGVATIEASLNDVRGSAKVNVTDARLLDLDVLRQGDTMTVGTTQQLRARAHFSDQQNIDVTDLSEWSSEDGNLATVDENGMVSAHSPGQARFWARYLGQTAQVSVRITDVDQAP